MQTLTKKELSEMIWFLKTVQSWKQGGPYGDGEDITNKKGYASMEKIISKIQKI